MLTTTSFPAKRVCILGLGYIGLPTAAILASRGHIVAGVDVNEDVVSTINEGRIHIVEPELDLLVKTAVESGRLTATDSALPAEVFIICVPTPVSHETHTADLRFVESAALEIARVAVAGNLVILESTSPPGTTERVVGGALAKSGLQPGKDVHLAYCPERVLPGAILRECVSNDRVVGGYTPKCSELTAEFYRSFVQGELLVTDCRTAETVKLVENASRDVQIAFANELSLISHSIGVDVWEVIKLANHHPRVNILQPGPGVGGHCIAVDPWFLIHSSPRDADVMRAARARNDSMPKWVASRIAAKARESGAKVVALLGMAYKNDIDDCRESPSLEVYAELRRIASELLILACEPNCTLLEGIDLFPLTDCVERAELLVLLVPHREFRALDWKTIQETKAVLDFKGIVR
jgi:UDP-N-acetyl-D-mannosaminuronic acid dehydrogenase